MPALVRADGAGDLGDVLVAAPGLAIMIATRAFNLLGDGLRDPLDVRLCTP